MHCAKPTNQLTNPRESVRIGRLGYAARDAPTAAPFPVLPLRTPTGARKKERKLAPELW